MWPSSRRQRTCASRCLACSPRPRSLHRSAWPCCSPAVRCGTPRGSFWPASGFGCCRTSSRSSSTPGAGTWVRWTHWDTALRARPTGWRCCCRCSPPGRCLFGGGRHGFRESRTLHELGVVLGEAAGLGLPVDIAGLAEIEPSQAAAHGDVGERIAVVMAPGPAAQVGRHLLEAAPHARHLLVAPGLAALLLVAQRLVAHEQPGVEHAIGERLPAAHGDAVAQVLRDELADRRLAVEEFDDDA